MSSPRLASALALLLSACASWENSPSASAPPPAETPVPSSRYAPPPPVEPGVTPPPGRAAEIHVAIASVQLLEDCPEPAAAPEPAASSRAPAGAASRQQEKRSSDYVEQCTQSTVQLAVHSDRSGPFRIEAIRVLDPGTQRQAGTTTLRQPTRWSADGSYVPWNERVTAGQDLQISYKLGELDLSRASERVGPAFNTFAGPFVLELDVSLDGARQTIRSAEFGRRPVEIMVT